VKVQVSVHVSVTADEPNSPNRSVARIDPGPHHQKCSCRRCLETDEGNSPHY
jgi:hypothetical protein